MSVKTIGTVVRRLGPHFGARTRVVEVVLGHANGGRQVVRDSDTATLGRGGRRGGGFAEKPRHGIRPECSRRTAQNMSGKASNLLFIAKLHSPAATSALIDALACIKRLAVPVVPYIESLALQDLRHKLPDASIPISTFSPAANVRSGPSLDIAVVNCVNSRFQATDVDYVFTFGGDGTVLHASSLFPELPSKVGPCGGVWTGNPQFSAAIWTN